MINAYLRADGRKGIRNAILVAYLVECAHHVAREIVYPYRSRGVQLVGFSGCYPNGHSHKMLQRLATHPNIGAVLLEERTAEPEDLLDALSDLLAGMSPRTRRPIRFLDPEQTRPTTIDPDSSLLGSDSGLPAAAADSVPAAAPVRTASVR